MRLRGLVVGAAALATVLATAAPSAATGAGCYGGVNPAQYQGQECTLVVGSGLKVTSISGKFNNTMPWAYLNIYIEFYGPNGHITNTTTMEVPPGGSTGYHTWHNPHPNANMTPGYYCTEAIDSDNFKPIFSDCIEVHT